MMIKASSLGFLFSLLFFIICSTANTRTHLLRGSLREGVLFYQEAHQVAAGQEFHDLTSHDARHDATGDVTRLKRSSFRMRAITSFESTPKRRASDEII